MEVYAVPGETIDVALRKGDDGQYRCHYLSGSSRDVARWLGANLDFSSLSLSRFEGSAAQAAAKADNDAGVSSEDLLYLDTGHRYTDPAHPAFGFMHAITTRLILACTIAPAHI